ncbi:hypothetical protein FRC02_002629 [Tulasnella sp. 418]|nr:hypothetical protein FRC02_002629 [Tulasnella sp. 418]
MGKGNTHRRPQPAKRIHNTRTRTKGQSLKLSDPERNSHELNLQLRSMGLYAANILGDGNCIFRALCDQLYGTPKDHLTLRREVCDWMESHKELYEGFIDEGTWSDHLNSMRIPGTYGGHVELSAFAHLKRRFVKVIQPGLVYVIDWRPGRQAADALRNQAGPSSSAQPSSSTPVESQSIEEMSTLSSREIRRLKRDRAKEAKQREVKQRQQASESDEEDDTQKRTIYVAYHDWEHFSSVRNLQGPHSGLPDVSEAPAPPSPSSPTHSRLRSSSMSTKPSNSKNKAESKHKPSTAIPALSQSSTRSTTADLDDSPPSFANSPSSSTTATSSSGQLPSTPPDSTALGITPKASDFKGRSPKRSFDETDDGGSGSEYGRKEGSKRRGNGKFVSSTTAQDEAKVEAEIEIAATEDEEDDSSFDTSFSESQSMSQSQTSTRSGTAEPPPPSKLTKRQMKKMGIPKPRPKRVVLLVGGQQKSKTRRSVQVKQPKEVDEEEEPAEWTRNGSGKLDVRGFRELKI